MSAPAVKNAASPFRFEAFKLCVRCVQLVRAMCTACACDVYSLCVRCVQFVRAMCTDRKVRCVQIVGCDVYRS